jgi:hypothetical protein
MTTCTSFPSFSALPQETRFNIWTLNLPGPRLVTLHYASPALDPFSIRGCTSPARIPTNLQINKEARTYTQRYYALSFNLPYFKPMIWFNPQQDILYFPPKEGWLGSWNHFVNALAMTAPSELGLVRRLAVNEALFGGLRGSSSPNVMARRVREFWEYVRRRFSGVEEVVVLVDEDADAEGRDEDVRVWMESVLGCVLRGKDEMEVGSREEKLLDSLEKGLRFVEQRNGWVAPRWDALKVPRHGDGSQVEAQPKESLAGYCCDHGDG